MMLLTPYVDILEGIPKEVFGKKYKKHCDELFTLFTNPRSAAGILITSTYDLECNDPQIHDVMIQCQWLIDNVPYFSKLGKNIKNLRNILAHNRYLFPEHLRTLTVELINFKHQRIELEDFVQKFTVVYLKVLQLILGKQTVIVEREYSVNPEELNGIHSLGWFKKYCKNSMKGRKMIIFSENHTKHDLFTFVCWNGMNAYVLDENNRKVTRPLNRLGYFYTGIFLTYTPPGISFEWLLRNTRQEVLRELKITLLSGRYESEKAKFLTINDCNKVQFHLIELNIYITVDVVIRVSI